MPKTKQENALLPLDQPRSIALKAAAAGRKEPLLLTWHFRRLTAKDWAKFFEGIVNRTLRHNGTEERIFDADSALVELVEDALRKVIGYEGAEGDGWKQKLPLRHKLAVGLVLRTVVPQRAPDMPLRDLVEVSLTTSWCAAAKDGRMTSYEGLVHRFRHPGVEHLRKFNLECSRTRILGTGEEGVTIQPARQSVALRLYDELIESVEGYSFNGEPLKSIEDIKAEMDGAHKATAALGLFDLGGERIEIL